jgi:predicted NAD/FAD-binding protein
MLRFSTRVNELFLRRDRRVSMYRFSYLNPLNLATLYRWARLFGVSREFWEKVFVPIHSATLITTSMRDLPAVVAPLLESVVPLDRPCEMTTWVGAPARVFDRMTAAFASRVHTGCEIVSVRRAGKELELRAASGERFRADRVVMACPAPAARAALDGAGGLARRLLARVRYVDDDDPTFTRFVIHSDTGILPEKDRDLILSSYNTYVEVDASGNLESTFVLSAGNPNLRDLGHPMLVTFNSKKTIRNVEAECALPRPTHALSLHNLANMLLLRYIQGRRGIYYCSGYTTPEGAHDLSFVSGLVAARAIGAAYPFDPAQRDALADFHRMQRLMLGRVLPDGPAPD